jgi:hypothetical protein
MPGSPGVLAGVTVRRAIAAKGDAALLAGAEMDPGRTDLYAFLTLGQRRLFDRLDRIDVRATFDCHFRVDRISPASATPAHPRRDGGYFSPSPVLGEER